MSGEQVPPTSSDPVPVDVETNQNGLNGDVESPIGLGIDHGPSSAKESSDPSSTSQIDHVEIDLDGEEDQHDVHPADRPPSPKETRSPAPEPITVEDEPVTPQTELPPPPPPKESTSPIAKNRGLPKGRPIGGESVASLQDIELSRGPTPAESVTGPPEPVRPPSTRPESRGLRHNGSVSSLHSLGSPSAPSPSRPGSARPGPSTHRRTSTQTTLSLASAGHPGSQLSTVLITPPLQVLVNSKEAKKSASFLAASQKALDLCQSGDGSNAAYLHPRVIFEPLRLAISNPQTTSVPILITSLDLLSKLISHSFFHEPNGPPRGLSPLPDLIAHTITLSYSETSPPQVALQVVKALMAIVLSTDPGMLVHQSSLLKAIRTVYNIFLLSNDSATQVVAQGGLTQMVHHVFERVVRPDARSHSAGLGRRSTVGENEARRLAESGTATPDVPGTPGQENQKITL